MAAPSLNDMSRTAILAAADSPSRQRFVRRYGMRLGASRFVAGETLDEVVVLLRGLKAKGLLTNTTILGERVSDEAQTIDVVEQYRQVLDRIATEDLRTNVALKLTHLGLALDEGLALRNVRDLVTHARERGIFVRMDMEESVYVDATLRIYRTLRGEGHANIGTVLQAYLYRSKVDLESLVDLQPNLRFVKGAYRESSEVAYSDKADVDRAYVTLVEHSLRIGGFTAIATYDSRLIARAASFAAEHAIPRLRFRFQMLYGVRPRLQLDLVEQGNDVLVATPYGPDWYRYLMRRLAERPANLVFFLRSLLRR